jgi:hypothetical protein
LIDGKGLFLDTGYFRRNIPSSSSSSVPFTPSGAQGIPEELPSVAISSYPLDLIP